MNCLNDLVRLARNQSPYFAAHFQSVDHVTELHELPIVHYAEYWAAAKADQRNILTGDHADGFFLRTGGTTDIPKLTHYSQKDWERVACLAALGLLDAGLEAGDRIANLFAAGDMYVSFDMMMMSMSRLPMPAVMLPLGWQLSPYQICDRIEQCRANVLLGHPTVLVTLAEYCVQHQRIFPTVTKVMYAGESFLDHHDMSLKRAFPRAICRPNLYGSVDCGLIASSAASKENNNDRSLFKVFRHTIWMEIVTEDEDQRVIEQNNISGAVVVTNLSRQLQPVIRYPIGDRAEWVDFDRRIFRLNGRTNSLVRVGTVDLDIEDFKLLIGQCAVDFKTVQVIIRQKEKGKDEVECLIAAKPCDVAGSRRAVVDILGTNIPELAKCIELGWLDPLKVSFVEREEMHLASSGKLRSIVDLRFELNGS